MIPPWAEPAQTLVSRSGALYISARLIGPATNRRDDAPIV
jgi:hypothetical protein